MKPLVDLLRDVLEQRLDQLNAHGLMLRLAHVWHRDVQARGLGTIIGSVAPEVQARWPLLSAWRWLVPTLDREVILSADTGGHSAAAVCAEGECDLAHRGVLPAALGRAILQAARGTPVPDDALPDAAEGFAHLLSSAQLAAEQARHRSLADRLRPAIDFTAVLLCGLRAARWQYSARTGLVASCVRSMQACSAPQPEPAMAGIRLGVPSPLARYQAWSTSPGGVVTLRALRWLAPTSAIMCSRLSSELGCRLSERTLQQIVRLAQASGVPVRTGMSLEWGYAVTWPFALEILHTQCACPALPGPLPALDLCSTCGRARLAPAPPEPLPCSWCHGLGDAVCRGCNHYIHFRPHCRWNCGAHAAYLPSAAHVVQLCPDCAFSWLSAVAASPLRPVHPPLQAALSAHIESVVSQVHPGAGHGVAQPPALSNRRIKRWLYRFLQRRSDPVTVSAALAACDGALGSPPGLSVGFRLCIENLRREGGMVLTVVAGEPAIALA